MTTMMPKISRTSTIHVSNPLYTIGPAATTKKAKAHMMLPLNKDHDAQAKIAVSLSIVIAVSWMPVYGAHAVT